MHVRDVMIAPAVTCRPADPADLCARLMKELNLGFLPVVDPEGRLCGVVTDRDLALRILASGRSASTPVKEIATHAVVTCAPDDELWYAEETLARARTSRLVVVEETRPVGVVTLADLAQAEDPSRFSQVYQHVVRREIAEPIPTGPWAGAYASWLI